MIKILDTNVQMEENYFIFPLEKGSRSIDSGGGLFISSPDIFLQMNREGYFALLLVMYNLQSCKIGPIEWGSHNLEKCAVDWRSANYIYQPNTSTSFLFLVNGLIRT